MEPVKFYTIIVICFIFFVIGCFGNIISIVIFHKKEFKSLPTTTYIIASNVVNIITVVYLPFIILPQLWTDLYPETISCQLFGFILILLVQIQSWIYTLCSLARCITTLTPHKYLFKNKYKFQLAIISICSITLFILSTPVIYFFKKQESMNQTSCEIEDIQTFFYFKYEFPLFRIVLPFIATIIASILTIYKLIVSKIRLGVRDWNNMKREYHLARSLIIMDLLFVVFRIPTFINISVQDNMLFLYTLLFSIFTLSGALHNVFSFLIFIILNRNYRDLFRNIFFRKLNIVCPENEMVVLQISSI